MDLGTFSVSLTVGDLAASRDFYETLGFDKIGGDGQGYLIMANGGTVIGLFQGMFDQNLLTFNPGWQGPNEEASDDFLDVRDIADQLEEAGLQITTRSIEGESGPGHIVLMDPDGNPVLIDQHR